MMSKRLMSLNKQSKKYVYLTVLMNTISIICNILIILFIGGVLDRLINKDLNLNLFSNLIYILALISIRFICNYKSSDFSFKSSATVRKELRHSIYEKLLEIGVRYSEVISTSSIIQVAVDGVEALEIYFGRYLPQLFYSLIAPIILFFVVSTISIKAALVFIISVPLIPLSIIAVMKIAKKLLSKYWNIYTNLGDSFLENLQGLTTLKIFDLDEEKNEEMNKEAENFRKITMKVLLMQLNSITIMDLVAFLGSSFGIIVAFSEFKVGAITPGEMVIVILLSAEFFIPLRLLGSYFHIAMNGIAASDKIFNLLDYKVEKTRPLKKEEKRALKNIDIDLNSVTFSYDSKRYVLKNINMEIKKGTMVALVGESGSGKSTITNLLMGFNKVNSGVITLNGIDINYIPFEILKEKIAFISHNSYIFNSTIEENIRFGKESASKKEIDNALKLSNLYDFVYSLKDGLKTKVGENGNLLSGGQKQRLALARMILKDPEIYIFDEATSNIDITSEEKIWQSIYSLAKEKTVIVISHRLQNVKDADTIYVLNKGKLIEKGNHSSLIKEKGKYYNLLKEQYDLEKVYEGLEA